MLRHCCSLAGGPLLRAKTANALQVHVGRIIPQAVFQQQQHLLQNPAQQRTFATSPLDAFRDTVARETRGQEPVGRQWSAKELRRKSYDDLHKLWYVLYKERNMLLTEQQLSRRRQIRFPQPERLQKVRKGMGAIKQVLGERKREKIAAFHAERENETTMPEDFIEVQ